MADDVKKSEVLSEPAGEAGTQPVRSADTPGSADPESVQTKKKVRGKPAAGESQAGEKQEARKETADTDAQKTRRVRRKRPENAQNDAAKAEEGTEGRKKKVHIKKADAHMDGEQKKVAKNAAEHSGAVKKTSGSRKKPAAAKKPSDEGKKPAAVKPSDEGIKPATAKAPSNEGKKPTVAKTADGEKKPTVAKKPVDAAKKAAAGDKKAGGIKKTTGGKKTVHAKKAAVKKTGAAPAAKAGSAVGAASAAKAGSASAAKPGTAPAAKTVAAAEAAPNEGTTRKGLRDAGEAIKKTLKNISEKHKKRMLITLGTILGIYLVFTIVFTFMFMPRTYLNGIKVSLKSYPASARMIKPLIDEYVLTVHNLDGSQDIVEGSNVHLKYESMKWVKEALKKQNQFAWPASFFKKNEITIEENISYDADRFEDLLEKLSGFKATTMTEPQDAHVAMDDTGNYVVFPEVLGTTIDVRAAEDAARECLLTGNPDLMLEEFHVLPKVYSTDEKLGIRLREWNEYMKSAGLTYLFWDTPEVLTREIINELISDGGDKLYVDEDKVMHLMAVWADRHDSLGRSFTFTTYEGYEVDIVPGGDYGYELNEEAVAQDIIEKLNAHDTGSYEVSYWRKPLFTTNNGLGGTYIEVSLSDQHMWMYNDGELVIDTPVVTGRPTDDGDRITHKGCFAVDWHDTNVTLGTYETRGYEQHVNYWIAFNQSEGIHDAKWREDGEFGGSTYLYNGSHGCVNTPIDAMEIVYDMVIDGEAVVVY